MSGRGLGEGRDLVVVALPGVQRFISEARTTADVAAASAIYQRLATIIVEVLTVRGEVVLPAVPGDGGGTAGEDHGTPNRIVALLPDGEGGAAARAASEGASAAWRGWVRLAFGGQSPATPGFPDVTWVCVPAREDGDYRQRWERAQRLLAGRKMVHDFEPPPERDWQRRALCSLTPRWPAEPQAPRRAPAHERETKLSAVGWVKRLWRYLDEQPGYPSTPSIASARYRIAVLERMGSAEVRRAVEDLARIAGEAMGSSRGEEPVPGITVPVSGAGRWFALNGGPWVYPDRWQARALAAERGTAAGSGAAARNGAERSDLARTAEAGRGAARRLAEAMKDVPRLPSYLAVLVQDLDGMGRYLSERAGIPGEHGRISRELLALSLEQRGTLRDPDLSGVLVYAGGDDLLAFVPAATALEAARRCHDLVAARDVPTASTAVLFFHYHASIQQAMREARELLKRAKHSDPRKHALAVGYLRRSGVRSESIQPWQGPGGVSSAELFGIFGRGSRLSPRLVAGLERDKEELASLAGNERVYRAELARLMRRHSADNSKTAPETVDALAWLARRAGGAHLPGKVGVFLRQEAR